MGAHPWNEVARLWPGAAAQGKQPYLSFRKRTAVNAQRWALFAIRDPGVTTAALYDSWVPARASRGQDDRFKFAPDAAAASFPAAAGRRRGRVPSARLPKARDRRAAAPGQGIARRSG